jgi:hypothetical protein
VSARFHDEQAARAGLPRADPAMNREVASRARVRAFTFSSFNLYGCYFLQLAAKEQPRSLYDMSQLAG